jgi:hypothetical protein
MPDRPPIWITTLALASLCPGTDALLCLSIEKADLRKPVIAGPSIPINFLTARPLAWRIDRAAEFAE